VGVRAGEDDVVNTVRRVVNRLANPNEALVRETNTINTHKNNRALSMPQRNGPRTERIVDSLSRPVRIKTT
jgi:hypothetical protein